MFYLYDCHSQVFECLYILCGSYKLIKVKKEKCQIRLIKCLYYLTASIWICLYTCICFFYKIVLQSNYPQQNGYDFSYKGEV